MQALYEAISALSLQLFNFSFKWIASEVRKCYLNATTHSHTEQVGICNFLDLFLQSKLDASEGQQGALVEDFFNSRVPTEAQFTEHLLASRFVRKNKPTAKCNTQLYAK